MDPEIPAAARGKKVTAPEIVAAPPPLTIYTRPSRMTLKVYDWCPEHGAHTDPELHGAYADQGI